MGTLIAQIPDICGGRPRVAGTGVSIRRIAGWHVDFGCSSLGNKASIHAALGLYPAT